MMYYLLNEKRWSHFFHMVIYSYRNTTILCSWHLWCVSKYYHRTENVSWKWYIIILLLDSYHKNIFNAIIIATQCECLCESHAASVHPTGELSLESIQMIFNPVSHWSNPPVTSPVHHAVHQVQSSDCRLPMFSMSMQMLASFGDIATFFHTL